MAPCTINVKYITENKQCGLEMYVSNSNKNPSLGSCDFFVTMPVKVKILPQIKSDKNFSPTENIYIGLSS
jgi:hypothetical protein